MNLFIFRIRVSNSKCTFLFFKFELVTRSEIFLFSTSSYSVSLYEHLFTEHLRLTASMHQMSTASDGVCSAHNYSKLSVAQRQSSFTKYLCNCWSLIFRNPIFTLLFREFSWLFLSKKMVVNVQFCWFM